MGKQKHNVQKPRTYWRYIVGWNLKSSRAHELHAAKFRQHMTRIDTLRQLWNLISCVLKVKVEEWKAICEHFRIPGLIVILFTTRNTKEYIYITIDVPIMKIKSLFSLINKIFLVCANRRRTRPRVFQRPRHPAFSRAPGTPRFLDLAFSRDPGTPHFPETPAPRVFHTPRFPETPVPRIFQRLWEPAFSTPWVFQRPRHPVFSRDSGTPAPRHPGPVFSRQPSSDGHRYGGCIPQKTSGTQLCYDSDYSSLVI